MNNWYMVTLVGEDRAGIVAQISTALYEHDCNLGEAAMMRLGGNFSIMLMVHTPDDSTDLDTIIQPIATQLALHSHIDAIQAHLHQHLQPNVRITVHGADRAGIVAKVTGALAGAGLHILDLASDVGGTETKPIYVMHIEGYIESGAEALRKVVAPFKDEGVHVTVHDSETLLG